MSTIRVDTLETTDSSFSIDIEDIGSAIDTTKVVADFDGLRSLDKTAAYKHASLKGAKFSSDYYLDTLDTTSPETVPTVILATDGGRWKLVHNGTITAFQCGLVADGVTVNSSATLNAVNAAVLAAGAVLVWGDGTFIMESVTLLPKQMWSGFGGTRSILKAKNNLNAPFLTTGTGANVDDVSIIGLCIDGNSEFNTTGNSVTLKGACPKMYKTTIKNSAATGLVTDYDTSTALRDGGFEGIFSDVLIDSPQRSGLVFNGPNDSVFTNLTIIDPSLEADNTHYGAFFTQSARATNIHGWNRSTISNTPSSMVLVASGGCNFSLSHFEGGHTPLKVQANGCTFSDCTYYAPRGAYCIENYGTGNKFSGTLGIGAFGGNLVFKGVLNSTALSGGADNMYDLIDLGCIGGAIEWAGAGGGGNFVRITGFRNTGTAYVGTPAANDDVNILIQGAGGGSLRKEQPVPFVVFPTTVVPESGSFTSAAVSFRYQLRGKLCFYETTVVITTNGTGAGAVQVTLPFTAAAFGYNGFGEESAGGKTVRGKIQASTNVLRIVDYTGAYPGASGSVIVVNGFYEVA